MGQLSMKQKIKRSLKKEEENRQEKPAKAPNDFSKKQIDVEDRYRLPHRALPRNTAKMVGRR